MPTFSKKSLALLLALTSLAAPAPADENPYDLVGKALVPLVKIFVPSAKTQNHAVTAVLVLDEVSGLPPEAVGQTLELAVQSPDKLRLHTTLLGEKITVCRNGQDIRAYPGSKIDALISAEELPGEGRGFFLGPLQLPITEKQLVFLPVLFQVHDAGSADVAGESCRVLDLVLMPELARALKAQNWTARLWVRPNDRLAKVELVRGDWHATLSIKKLEYAPSLPDETWQPAQDEASDILKLSPARYEQLLDAATRGLTKFKQLQ